MVEVVALGVSDVLLLVVMIIYSVYLLLVLVLKNGR
jgi:hypothetical protein